MAIAHDDPQHHHGSRGARWSREGLRRGHRRLLRARGGNTTMNSTDERTATPGSGVPAVRATAIGGFVEPGFEAVRDAFAAAAARPGGAAFAAYLEGRPVVDLWLGEAAPGRPWQQDTPAVMMSA